MKGKQYFTNMILLFWYALFAIAGLLIALLLVWITSAHYTWEDVMVIGATIGIITGGMAALMLFILNGKKNANHA